MNKKIIIAFTVVIILIIAAVLIIKNMGTSERVNNLEEGYVFDKSSNIKLKDIEAYYKVIDFKEENAKDYFKDEIVNPHTLQFLMFLDESFKEYDNKKDHFENVQKYLYSIMPRDMADKLLDLYKKFVDYQLTVGEKISEWGGMPKTVEQTIDLLHKVQDYRREVFGKDVADAMFGTSVKADEYPLRRGVILKDKNMYGAEKEKKLQQLNEDMWGDEADKVNAYADTYTKYTEKLDMYDKDLSEMNEEGKKAQIRAFREELFTPDQIQRWDNVEQAIVDRQNKEKAYEDSENEIMSDPNLDQEEKEKKVQELQDQIFGEEAEAVRRSLAIKRGSEAILKNLKKQ